MKKETRTLIAYRLERARESLEISPLVPRIEDIVNIDLTLNRK